jgi:hypothetical protein
MSLRIALAGLENRPLLTVTGNNVHGKNVHGKNVHIYGRKKCPGKKCPPKRKKCPNFA